MVNNLRVEHNNTERNKHLENYTEDERQIIRSIASIVVKRSIQLNEKSVSIHTDFDRGPIKF